MASTASVNMLPARPGSRLDLPRIFLGGGVFGLSYNGIEYLESEGPAQTIRAAFRAGLTAVDTSPFYTTSEALLGRVLTEPSFASEFPRESYALITKCGRYGSKAANFDYSPERIEASIKLSCHRLGTDYLDGVYLHDVEFIATDVGDACAAGFPLAALEAEHQSHFGLAPEQADTVHGPGDETILAALGVLFALRERGVVRAIGIAGYPLPTLLRLARLARARLGRPLDLVQSYSHLTLQNRALLAYVPLLRDAGVASVVNASPLSMGLLRAGPSPAWHPAPATLRAVVRECGVAKPEAASFRYGLRAGWDVGVPTVTGCSTVAELEMALEAYGDGGAPAEDEEASTLRSAIEGAGYADWSWPSPPTATARSRQEK